MGIYIGLDNIRHTADHYIAIEQLAHGLVNGIRNRRSRFIAILEVLNGRFLHAVSPQIFFQVHGIHLIKFLKAHRVGPHLFVPDTQKGTGFDIVKAAVLHQKLDGGPGVGARLNFIQKHQRVAGDHWFSGVGSQIRDDRIGVQIPGEYLCCVGIGNKIDFHKTGILFLTKLTNNGCLANLTCPHNAKGLSFRLSFPLQQPVICLPIQHFVTS